jgi:hypothetical protein
LQYHLSVAQLAKGHLLSLLWSHGSEVSCTPKHLLGSAGSEVSCAPKHILGSSFLATKQRHPVPSDNATRQVNPPSPVLAHRRPQCAAQVRASAVAHTDFCIPHAPTTLLRTGSHPLIVSITIHDAKLSHILIITGALLDVMSLHGFEALRIPISGLCLVAPIHGFSYDLMEPYGSILLLILRRLASALEHRSGWRPRSDELGPPIHSRSTVDRARHGPRPCGPSLRGFPLQKQLQKFVISINPRNFLEKPLFFSKINL